MACLIETGTAYSFAFQQRDHDQHKIKYGWNWTLPSETPRWNEFIDTTKEGLFAAYPRRARKKAPIGLCCTLPLLKSSSCVARKRARLLLKTPALRFDMRCSATAIRYLHGFVRWLYFYMRHLCAVTWLRACTYIRNFRTRTACALMFCIRLWLQCDAKNSMTHMHDCTLLFEGLCTQCKICTKRRLRSDSSGSRHPSFQMAVRSIRMKSCFFVFLERFRKSLSHFGVFIWSGVKFKKVAENFW